jgi:hypothetical protein
MQRWRPPVDWIGFALISIAFGTLEVVLDKGQRFNPAFALLASLPVAARPAKREEATRSARSRTGQAATQ